MSNPVRISIEDIAERLEQFHENFQSAVDEATQKYGEDVPPLFDPALRESERLQEDCTLELEERFAEEMMFPTDEEDD